MISPVLLVIEDNPADLLLIREALERTGFSVGIHVIRDGQEAIEWIARTITQNQALPDLIVLNCYLPRRPALEVLRFLRTQPALAHTPVVVTGPSMIASEIGQFYEAGASAFVSKYGDYPMGLISRFEAAFRFWFGAIVPVRACLR